MIFKNWENIYFSNGFYTECLIRTNRRLLTNYFGKEILCSRIFTLLKYFNRKKKNKKKKIYFSKISKLLFACVSQRADWRISHKRIMPLLLLYTNKLHSFGWNSAAVITSVSSSMFAGFMSTISSNLFYNYFIWFKIFSVQIWFIQI